MRVVREDAAFDAALASARREARTAFGDDRLILERFLEGPRHVEVQVLFDAHGAGVHLGERDCSLQRRHQKVLEETPSPAVDPELRAELGARRSPSPARSATSSAGTCEFLVDDDGRSYFLEMNTRLQVEHPVTEMATGRDLVADQLADRARASRSGSTRPSIDAGWRPAATPIEVRLYAEDAEVGFLPATGRVEATPLADRRRTARPGRRRDRARDRGRRSVRSDARQDRRRGPRPGGRPSRGSTAALDDTVVLGLTTNLRFLRWLVRQPVVSTGEARIDTLDRIWPPDDPAARRACRPTPPGRPPPGCSIGRSRPSRRRRPAAVRRGRPDPWAGGWRLNARPRLRLAADGRQRANRRRPEPIASAIGPARSSAPTASAHVDVDGRSVAFRLAPPRRTSTARRASRPSHHGGGIGGEVVVADAGSGPGGPRRGRRRRSRPAIRW